MTHPYRSASAPAMIGFALLLLGGIGIVACSDPTPAVAVLPIEDSGPEQAGGNSYTGLYVYFADSARFTDCASGLNLPVTANAGGLELERAYLGARREQLQPLLVEVTGSVETLPGMEEGTMLPHLSVSQLIRLTDDHRCP